MSVNVIALLLFVLPLHAVDLFDIQEIGEIRVRDTVDLRKVKRNAGQPYGIFFAGLASHEIFWDGVRIGGGGVVGRTAAEEVPGPIEAHYAIPEQLATPGLHVLEMRASAFHRGFTPAHGYWQLGVASYDAIVTGRSAPGWMALIALSAMALTGIFSFAMYFVARRDRSFLLLGTLCLTSIAMLFAEAWRSLFAYTYDWHIVRLRIIVTLSWLVGVQLVALVVTRFPHRFGRVTLAATAIVAAVLPFIPRAWDPKSIFIFILCGGVATLWTAAAALRRAHGSLLALVGVTTATLAIFVHPGLFLDYIVYFALDFLFVCLLCSHALEVRRQQDEKARLELEVVRRHLQPHFLMNTLTALSEWIEREPKTAVRMIDALADELRLLGDSAGRQLVPASEELRLCATHLANMSLRRDVVYDLQVEGVDADRLVPPAMFHTLVENAITHAPAAAAVTLRLRASAADDKVRYVFESPAGEDTPREGGGTRYIKARLREAWGNAWTLTQGRSGDVWRTVIEVPS